jgi:hypothetical protein
VLPRTRLVVLAVLALTAAPVFGATYIVPSDAEMVRRSDAIVVGTVLTSFARIGPLGGIETVTLVTVDETIKGVTLNTVISVVEPGGTLNGRYKVVFGTPRFEEGERVLLLLKSLSPNEWVVADLALGKFEFATDVAGRQILVRQEGDIAGWDPHFRPHRERRRSADRFLAFIRSEVSGLTTEEDYFVAVDRLQPVLDISSPRSLQPVLDIDPFRPISYAMDFGGGAAGRWTSFPVTYRRGTSGAPANAAAAVGAALNAWATPPCSAAFLIDGGTGSGTQGVTGSADGENSILFERNLSSFGQGPFNCSSGGLLGVGGVSSASSPMHNHGGDQFFTTNEGDVEMNQGLTACTSFVNSGDYISAITHEVGHSLSIRHADQNRSNGPCSGPDLECASSAIMRSFVSSGLNGNLAEWDAHAVEALYPRPGCGSTCTAPGITSVGANPTSINAGQTSTLTVAASGTAPLSFQWYVGNTGNLSSPVPGGTAASINVSPSSTTTYWVRVIGQCAPAADSSAVTVTVTGPSCTPPSVNSVGANPTSITTGQTSTLTLTATGTGPLTIQWYVGNPGDTSSPVPGGTAASINVSPSSTTTYWVRVTGQCAPQADSGAVTVTVTSGGCPAITAPSPIVTPISGGFVLTSNASGGSIISVSWFQGQTGSGPNVGSGLTLSVNPAVPTSYWYRAANNCGNAGDSPAVTVSPQQICTPPSVQGVTASSTSISPGQSATLSVTASGSSLLFQWFQGNPGDTSTPVFGATNFFVSVTPTQTTTYWVRVSSGCGGSPADSAGITINVASQCPVPSVSQPPNQKITAGTATNISVNASGTAPLIFQWFRGPSGDSSTPVGTNSSTLNTGVLTSPTQFWVKVTSSCGASANSGTITIDVAVPVRRRAVRR